MAKQQIQIKANDEKIKGEYANLMQIAHTKEEFVLDFLSAFSKAGVLVSRVVTSPGHIKRMVAAMQGNLEKYEEKFGKIEEDTKKEEQTIGFE